MEIWFRNVDRRVPFAWVGEGQPAGRWHGAGEGPVQYLADTPDGAWAEFLRHEEITDPAELVGVARTLWAIELDPAAEAVRTPDLPRRMLRGGMATYGACQGEARRLRNDGATALDAPSAALDDVAGERVVAGGLVRHRPREPRVRCLFGQRFELRGWRCVVAGAPDERLLPRVRHLSKRRRPIT